MKGIIIPKEQRLQRNTDKAHVTFSKWSKRILHVRQVYAIVSLYAAA